MHRDMELVRAILLYVNNHKASFVNDVQLGRFDSEQVAYNINLLVEKGYLKGIGHWGYGRPYKTWIDIRLTLEGHDLADVIEDETKWVKIKLAATEKDVPFTLSFINQYLSNTHTATTNNFGELIGRDKVGRSKFDVGEIVNSENVHIGDKYIFEVENTEKILAVEKGRRKREILEEANNTLSEFHESASLYWTTSLQECENRKKGEQNVKEKEEQIKSKQSLYNQFLKISSTKSKLNLLNEHKIIDDINGYIGFVGSFFAQIEAGLELNIIPDLDWIKGCGTKQNELLQIVFDDLGIVYDKDTE